MKVVINRCYGGFSLSPAGLKAYAKRKGRECYFFVGGIGQKPYRPATAKELKDSLFFTAFDVPTAPAMGDEDGWAAHYLTARPDDRTDPDLVAVVEEMGAKADGSCAALEVVEIPDGVEWEIDEYDGIEHIAEKHRTWP